MTGIPVVAIGPKAGNSPYEPGQETYEIPDLIEHQVSGFYSDDIKELRLNVQYLLDHPENAKLVGQNGRKKAIEIFGKETIKKQWKEFFDKL